MWPVSAGEDDITSAQYLKANCGPQEVQAIQEAMVWLWVSQREVGTAREDCIRTFVAPLQGLVRTQDVAHLAWRSMRIWRKSRAQTCKWIWPFLLESPPSSGIFRLASCPSTIVWFRRKKSNRWKVTWVWFALEEPGPRTFCGPCTPFSFPASPSWPGSLLLIQDLLQDFRVSSGFSFRWVSVSDSVALKEDPATLKWRQTQNVPESIKRLVCLMESMLNGALKWDCYWGQSLGWVCPLIPSRPIGE